jgi:hypothetical protein
MASAIKADRSPAKVLSSFPTPARSRYHITPNTMSIINSWSEADGISPRFRACSSKARSAALRGSIREFLSISAKFRSCCASAIMARSTAAFPGYRRPIAKVLSKNASRSACKDPRSGISISCRAFSCRASSTTAALEGPVDHCVVARDHGKDGVRHQVLGPHPPRGSGIPTDLNEVPFPSGLDRMQWRPSWRFELCGRIRRRRALP